MSCPNKPEENKSCMANVGKPVNPILGCKILTERPDVFIDAPLPLVWSRSYASDVAYEGLLGQGWSFGFGYRLEILDDRIHVYDSYGKKDVFPLLSIGTSHRIAKGGVELARVSEGYVLLAGAKQYTFVSHAEDFRLVHIKDNNDNAITFLYEEGRDFVAYIALDNHRLFRVLGSEHRVLGLEELVFDTEHLALKLLKTPTSLYLIDYHDEDDYTGLALNMHFYAMPLYSKQQESPRAQNYKTIQQ